MKISSSHLLNIMIVAILVTSLFLISARSIGGNNELNTLEGEYEYDPWADTNDDGIINMMDIYYLILRFMESGEPINKTELLLQLQCSRPIPNGDFEKGLLGMGFEDIIDWNCTMFVHEGNPPTGETLEIWNMYFYSRGYSLHSYIQTNDVVPESDNFVSHYITTKDTICTTANYVSFWAISDFAESSRYQFRINLIISDGVSTVEYELRLDGWYGPSEYHWDYYNGTETGNDGNTWYRYTRPIPDYMDKSNLNITIEHRQGSWDSTTAQSYILLDNVYFSDANGNPMN